MEFDLSFEPLDVSIMARQLDVRKGEKYKGEPCLFVFDRESGEDIANQVAVEVEDAVGGMLTIWAKLIITKEKSDVAGN